MARGKIGDGSGRRPGRGEGRGGKRLPDTVRSVGDDFITKYARPRNRTADEVARMFELHLYPVLGHRPIENITRRDILDLLDGSKRNHRARGPTACSPMSAGCSRGR